MRQRVLITGGSGLLALNWAQAMRDRCVITLGLHNRHISLAGTISKMVNLESVSQLVRVFDELECKVVINAAGLTSIERCESDPALAQHANVTLASNIAKACAKLGIQLVQISTDHLFSGQESMVSENHPISPLNIYGKTKAEAEFRVLEIDPRALVIRTNFYGWGTRYRQSFSDMVLNALRSHKEITLFQDVLYTPILIETVSQVVHDLIDINAGGIFNVVGDDRISKCEFGRIIAEKFKLDSSKIVPGLLSNQSKLIQRPFDLSLSTNKVRKLLNRSEGSVRSQIETLRQQEFIGLTEELQKL
jgi:dTDP-4-dehydrorhamnose reductase